MFNFATTATPTRTYRYFTSADDACDGGGILNQIIGFLLLLLLLFKRSNHVKIESYINIKQTVLNLVVFASISISILLQMIRMDRAAL